MPASCWMHWSRHCTNAALPIAADWCIIRIGAQYVSIPYTERRAEAGIEPSVGSVGDSYDNLWTPPAAIYGRLPQQDDF